MEVKIKKAEIEDEEVNATIKIDGIPLKEWRQAKKKLLALPVYLDEAQTQIQE